MSSGSSSQEKKDISTSFGKVTVSNTHGFSCHESGFKISPFLLEKMAFVGQLNVYEKSAEVLSVLMGCKTTSMQINKVVKYYGEQCAKEDHLLQPTLKDISADDKVYLMMDGSFIFTRQEGWKEVKAMRMFKSKDCKHIEGKSSYINHSQYLAVVDEAKSFTAQIDKLLLNYKIKSEQLVIISDGAPWIKNYAEDSFEKAISILDFYHALAYLHKFKNEAFTDADIAHKWVDKQIALLHESEVKKVIKNIQKTGQKNNCKNEAAVIIKYYTSNINRMDYKKYKTIGMGLIGSGAMESTHRTLIQNRCKQSGQVWSIDGLQKMLNLRTVYMNEDANKIRNISIKKAA